MSITADYHRGPGHPSQPPEGTAGWIAWFRALSNTGMGPTWEPGAAAIVKQFTGVPTTYTEDQEASALVRTYPAAWFDAYGPALYQASLERGDLVPVPVDTPPPPGMHVRDPNWGFLDALREEAQARLDAGLGLVPTWAYWAGGLTLGVLVLATAYGLARR